MFSATAERFTLERWKDKDGNQETVFAFEEEKAIERQQEGSTLLLRKTLSLDGLKTREADDLLSIFMKQFDGMAKEMAEPTNADTAESTALS